MRSKRENTYGVPARTLTDAHYGRITHGRRAPPHGQDQDALRPPKAVLP